MAARRLNDQPAKKAPRRPPAKTPEAREQQLTSLAFDLAEKQLRDGSASAQVISHYLKLGTEREKLERKRLSIENELAQAKIEMMASQKNVEELYKNALNAMRSYQGQDPNPETFYHED